MGIKFESWRAASRKPGQYGREVVRRNLWRWLAVVFLLVVAQLVGFAVGVHGALAVVGEVALIALMLLVDRKVNASLDRRVRGARGEVKVGAILDGLASAGWRTIHDATIGRGNLDDIAIGPGGVLAIETKNHRGRISTARVSERWIAQAYAKRKSVEGLVGMRVDALLVLSEAYLVGKPVSRQRGVLVLPARLLAGHLARRRKVLTPEQVDAVETRLASTLESRSR